MKFFKLYIGDYQRDTGHLSVAEHGAFLLMLQHYYATEKPLPTGKALHRLLRATEKHERDAIDTVSAMFWTETEQGLVNARADDEIGKASHQREVNREIGKRGGRPKKTESVTESDSEQEPNHNPNQTPDSRQKQNQERFQTGEVLPASPPREEPDNRTAAGTVCARLRAEAGMIHTNPHDPRLIAALDAGTPPDLIVSTAREYPGKPLAYVVQAARGRHQDSLVPIDGGLAHDPANSHRRTRTAGLSAPDRVRAAIAERDARLAAETGGRTFDNAAG